MEIINTIFYYIVLYIPLVTLILVKMKFINNFFLDEEKHFVMKHYTLPYTQFLVGWLIVSVVIYFVFGFFVSILALFGIFTEFKDELEDPLYIFNALKAFIELTLFASFFASFRLFDSMKLDFTFARAVVKRASEMKKKPSELIGNIYLKSWGLFLLYLWITINIYYQLFGKFEMLEGAHRFVLPTLFY